LAEQYRIVCTEQEPVYQPTTHAHIVAVGTGTNPDAADKRWTLDRVLAAIDRGDTFYTKGTSSGKVALVRKVACPTCRRYIIRSAPDAVWDNNLDSLRRCRF
jgi:hypothetical protein